MNEKKGFNTKTIVTIGVFAAIISILSALPLGFNVLGVPATLQTLAMAFAGYTLGYKKGTLTVFIYILLGAIGLPVFNGFKGGFDNILGVTGGFIIGFLFLGLFCGLGTLSNSFFSKAKLNASIKKIGSGAVALVSGVIGLLICHLLGVLWGSHVLSMSYLKAASLISIGYLPKDILSVVLAYLLAVSVRTALVKAKLSEVIR